MHQPVSEIVRDNHEVKVLRNLVQCIGSALSREIEPSDRQEILKILLQDMIQQDLVTSLAKIEDHRDTLRTLARTMPTITNEGIEDAMEADDAHIRHSLVRCLKPDMKSSVLGLDENHARGFMITLMKAKTHEDWDKDNDNDTYQLLVKLSVVSKVVPPHLEIEGILLKSKEIPIATGGFADVYRGTYSGKTVAVKRPRLLGDSRLHLKIQQRLCREASTWQELRHSHVLPFIGIDVRSFLGYTCMVSLWMKHGTVINYLESAVGTVLVDKFIYETALGIEYLHNMDIVHGDIRGANILIDEKRHVRLADFGLAKFAGSKTVSLRTRSGSLRWMAPELVRPASAGLEEFQRTFATDVFAFARVCLELYTKRPPFDNVDAEGDIVSLVSANVHPPRPAMETQISDEMWGLMEQCWTRQSSERPKSMDVVQRLLRNSTNNVTLL